jgi:two-component system response regulator AtoC
MAGSERAVLHLVVRRDGVLVRTLPLAGVLTIGRDTANDVVIEDGRSSRQHCRIEVEPDRITIVDLTGSSGTFVNGHPVEHALLTPGDQIQVGSHVLTVEEPGTSAPTAPDKELTLLLSILDGLDPQAPGTMIGRILEALSTFLGADRALLVVANVDGKLTISARYLRPGSDASLPYSESLIREVMRTRASCLINDLGEEGDAEHPSMHRLAEAKVRSVIVTPVELAARTAGTLYLDSPAARRKFTRPELGLLERAVRHLAGLIESLDQSARLKQENAVLKSQTASEPAGSIPLEKLFAPESPFAGVMALITKAASRDISVLLCGETGTGKEVAARALHRFSSRSARRFLAINCGAIPESLIESELFGHQRGAFSGAQEDRAGLMELAHQGTLFLDEVAELPLAAQVKLLRVLEDHQVVRLGSSRPIRTDFRLIAATHRDLARKVEDGSFREDLYYRLNVFPIELPPLRKRPMDLHLLVKHLVAVLAPRLQSPVGDVAPEVLERLRCAPWRGNIRELRNVLERALVLEEGPVLKLSSLPVELTGGATATAENSVAASVNGPPASVPAEPVQPFEAELAAFEERYFSRLVQEVGTNIAGMARVSGLSRVTIYRKLGRYGYDQ